MATAAHDSLCKSFIRGNRMARTPDSTELLAEKHLRGRFSDVVYEPDGNVSPDFLVNKNIAVEVRRLNQNQIVNGKIEGLEESSIPLSGRIKTLLKSFGPPQNGKSWFVTYRFHRPEMDWQTLNKSLRDQLEAFKRTPKDGLSEVEIGDSFQLTFIPATNPLKTLFCLGGYTDHDSGGWILSEVDRNIKICIDLKSSKINRKKYGEWWLLLVDHIGYSLSNSDRKEFKSFFNFKHSWDRIIIVDPLNPINFFEI